MNLIYLGRDTRRVDSNAPLSKLHETLPLSTAWPNLEFSSIGAALFLCKASVFDRDEGQREPSRPSIRPL